MKLKLKRTFGKTGPEIPRIVYGTSSLGNLYQDLPYEQKKALVRGWFDYTEKPVMIDSAGKYGAGLALEMIGKILTELNTEPSDILISNKLGWYRSPLKTPEPLFEPGIWKNLKYDAVQKISYNGIIECWKQGNELLGGTYKADIVSVHDPDEYLAVAKDPNDRSIRFEDILDAYKALFELKEKGLIISVGIGSKDWKVIREFYDYVKFDWIMFANSFTIMKHPPEFMTFLNRLHDEGTGVINSAVFHAGFLTGGKFFDYQEIKPDSTVGKFIYPWRDRFSAICHKYGVDPSEACIKFATSHPAVAALALNTSKPATMEKNVKTFMEEMPGGFWAEMKKQGLIDPDYPFV